MRTSGSRPVTRTGRRLRLGGVCLRVGPVTAAAFVSAIDDVMRFREAHEVKEYLGLVPCELSSVERQRRRRITKAGHTHVGWLLCRRLDLLVCRLGIEPRTPDQKFGLGARSPRDLRVAGCRLRQISARFATQPQPGKSRRLTRAIPKPTPRAYLPL
jgi:transposase